MGGPGVVFNYSAWIAAYPTFKNVDEPEAQDYFNWATAYFDNYGWPGSTHQAPRVLNLLTCHLAWLFAMRDANGVPNSAGPMPAPQTVGRVANASEGSVNVTLEWAGSGSPSEAFFTQTSWGAAAWQAMAGFRTMKYAPRPTRVANGTFPSAPYGRIY